jgi:hypothetical protein
MHGKRYTDLENKYAKLEDIFGKYKVSHADLQENYTDLLENYADLNKSNSKLKISYNVLDRSFQKYKTAHLVINYALIAIFGGLSLGMALLLYFFYKRRTKNSKICIPDKPV